MRAPEKSRLNRVKIKVSNHQVKKEQLQNKLAIEFETKKIPSRARERSAFGGFYQISWNARLGRRGLGKPTMVGDIGDSGGGVLARCVSSTAVYCWQRC